MRAFLDSRYSPEFCTFLLELFKEGAREPAMYGIEEDNEDDWQYFLGYQLAVILVLTLAYNVDAVAISAEAVAISIDFGCPDSLLDRFFDFCGKQNSAVRAWYSLGFPSIVPDSQTQPRLRAPLSRLHTLDFTHKQNRVQLSNYEIESLLLFPGLTECRASGVTWTAKESIMLVKLGNYEEPTTRHFEINYAIFSSSRRKCDLAIRDAILEISGPSLETLVLHVDHNVPDPDDEDDFVSRELLPRGKIDFTPLGDALRTHTIKLRRFDLNLYEDVPDCVDEEDKGTLGDLRDVLKELVYLKVPVSRLDDPGVWEDLNSDDDSDDSDDDDSRDSQSDDETNLPAAFGLLLLLLYPSGRRRLEKRSAGQLLIINLEAAIGAHRCADMDSADLLARGFTGNCISTGIHEGLITIVFSAKCLALYRFRPVLP